MNSDKSVLTAVEEITGEKIPYYHLDLCDLEQTENIFKDHQDIQGVIHFAALKSVGESVEKPLLYFRNNVASLINILDLCLKYHVKAFIFSSSCTVYGDVTKSPVDENTPLQDAESSYGRTKQIGEQIIADTLKNAGMKSILLRYFNPAGAHPSAKLGEAPNNPALNLVPVMTETAIGKRKGMTVFGTTINPNMILLARESRGFSQSVLAEKLNSYKANISRLEHGDTAVDDEILIALSEATNYPPHFFLQKGEILPVNLSCRKRKNVPAKLITPIEAQ